MHYKNIGSVALWSLQAAFAYPTEHLTPNPPLVTDVPSNITYEGIGSGHVESFLNIKFAHDTSGQNRFAPPLAYSYESGTRVNASAAGAACPQRKVPLPGFKVFSNVTSVSEDCLTLRIDRPANTRADAKLPVLLWIYGGGDAIGQIYDHAYDPIGLVIGSAKKGKPIIYAAMNYRLGFLGWSAFEEKESTARPNVGLLDQRMGMEWIQKNIALFGGDPEKVTIFGESDGATAVSLQLSAYGGDRPAPFKRAIMQSGSALADPGVASNITLLNTQNLTRLLNCSNVESTVTSVDCLRDLKLDDVLPAEINFTLSLAPFGGFDVFMPTVDHDFIPSAPSELFRTARFAKNISTIIGWNENDGSLFAPSPKKFANSSYLPAWLGKEYSSLQEDHKQEVLRLYPANSSTFAGHGAYPQIPIDWFIASQIVRDAHSTCPGLFMTQSVVNYSVPEFNTSSYVYALNSTLFSDFLATENASFERVTHFSDIPYVFNQATAYNASEEQISLSSSISGSWVEFAYSGDPAPASAGNDSVSDWPEAIAEGAGVRSGDITIRIIGGPEARVANAGEKLTLDQDLEELGRRCAFWTRSDIQQALGV